MAAKIIDLSGMLEIGFRLRTLLRPVMEEATPPYLRELAADVEKALRDRAEEPSSNDVAKDPPD